MEFGKGRMVLGNRIVYLVDRLGRLWIFGKGMLTPPNIPNLPNFLIPHPTFRFLEREQEWNRRAYPPQRGALRLGVVTLEHRPAGFTSQLPAGLFFGLEQRSFSILIECHCATYQDFGFSDLRHYYPVPCPQAF